jgi:DNA-directed RNA polymerase subunit omega
MKKEKITIDELLTKIPNKYELAIVAGRSAREEFIDGVEKYKIMDNVFEEIMNDEILLHNK